MAAEGQNLPSAVQESSQRSDDSLNSERGSEGRSPQPSPQLVSAGAKPGLVRRDMSFSSSNALANLEEAALGLGIQLPGARPRGVSDVSLGSGEASNTNLASLMEEPEGTPEVSTRDMKVGAVVMERWQLTRLHAVAEINFLASIGDLPRFKVAVEKLRVDVASERLVDYDMRHPLHVACDSGSFAVTEWLLEQGAPINIIDRFGNTPLSCSVKSRHKLVVQLLDGKGGLVPESRNSTKLVNLYESSLHGNVEVPEDDQDDQWEIPVDSLVMEGLLGEGMFGSVFQAKWRGTPVAVKRLKLDIAANETALNEFKSEIDVQHTLHHPNVVQFFGVVTKSDPWMIVTELMLDGTLEKAFKRDVAFSKRTATTCMIDCARGLTYLHNLRPNPIVHRDLKPANLMITPSHRIKITDFGLSKTFRKKGPRTDKYKMTGETGSYRYMAPEVFQHLPYGAPVDVYALSMIAYQCYTWRLPFDDVPGVEAVRLAASEDACRPPVNTLAKDIRDVLVRMWHATPDDRPTTSELITEFEAILAGIPDRKAPSSSSASGGGCCAVQ